MNDEELKRLWNDPAKQALITFNKEQLSMELDTKLQKLETTLKARNNRETYAAIILISLAPFAACFVHPLLSKIGALLVIPYCSLVIYVLKQVGKYKVIDNTLSLSDYLVQYKRYLEKERMILKNVAWWYILPGTICQTLFFIGFHKYIFLSVLFLNPLVYYLNRKAARNYFTPLIHKIDDEINALQNTEN